MWGGGGHGHNQAKIPSIFCFINNAAISFCSLAADEIRNLESEREREGEGGRQTNSQGDRRRDR